VAERVASFQENMSSMLSSSPPVDDDNDNNSTTRYEEVKEEVMSTISTGDDEVVAACTTKTTTSWTEAHGVYCTKYRTLRATTQQVINETCKDGMDIPWELPNKKNGVLTEANEVVEFLRSKRGRMSTAATTTTTTTPTKRSYIPSIAQTILSPLRVINYAGSSILGYLAANDDDDYDDDVDEWKQEGDDAFTDDDVSNKENTSSSSPALGLNTPIVNFVLIESVIQCSENEICRLSADTSSHIVLGLSEWNSWISKLDIGMFQNMNSRKNNFSFEDNDFLLQALVGLNKARIFRRPKQNGLDVIVLSSTNIITTTDTNKSSSRHDNDECIPENLRVHICLWDIQKAIERNEEKLQEWSEQINAYNVKALQYKKRNQIKLAINQVTRRKVIEKQIESTFNIKLTLEQTKTAIESASTNQSMIELMADSTKVLKKIREETPIEDVDQVVDDLQSELDEVQVVNDSLVSLGVNGSMYDEDELWKELEGLSLDNSVIIETSVPEKRHDTKVEASVLPSLDERNNHDDAVKSTVSNGVECEKSIPKLLNDTEKQPALA
jgi:hypothetical protein